MASSRRDIDQEFSGYLGSWAGVITVVALLFGIWLADRYAGLKSLNDLTYDACLRATWTWTETPAKVLLVELPAGQPSTASQLDELITKLTANGAGRIGLTITPTDHESLTSGQVVVGKTVLRDRVHPTNWLFVDPANRESAAESGVMTLPVSQFGICREHQPWVEVQGAKYPSFELLLASESVTPRVPLTNSAPMRINYRGGVGSLPVISAQEVRDGHLVPELVRDRVVLIGAAASETEPEIHTPTTDGQLGMSLLEYRGHIVNTLLTNSALHPVSEWTRQLILLTVGLTSLLVFQRTPVRVSIFLLFGGQLVSTIAAVVLLGWFQIWIPLLWMGLLQTICLVAVLDRRSSYIREALNRLMFETSSRIWQRRWPDFFTQQDPWPQIMAFIRQTLDLDRLIILELQPGRHHLREVGSANCTMQAIVEPRRDIHRRPYSDALAAHAPLMIDSAKRPFLTAGPKGELQYLVPLRFAGRVFGFIALSVDAERIRDRAYFESQLSDFADQTAELLHRRQTLNPRDGWSRRLVASLSMIPEEAAYSDLYDATSMIDQRLDRLEQIFHESTTATVVFDLFGRQIMVNERMQNLLAAERIANESLTTIDLIARITGGSLDSSRAILSQVISQKGAEIIPVRINPLGRSWALQVRPLLLAEDQTVAAGEAAPFRIRGILCELIERIGPQPSIGTPARPDDTLGRVSRQLAAIDAAMNELTTHDSPIVPSTIPEVGRATETSAVLDRAVALVARELNAKHLQFQKQSDSFLPPVVAVPPRLLDLLCAVLRVVIADARPETSITCDMQLLDEDLVLTFADRGAGMLTDELGEALEGRAETTTANAALNRASHWIAGWGGSITGSGRRDEGLLLRVQLIRADATATKSLVREKV